ncbi:DUF4189 domain-containing protein [Sphingopyxis sp.]|uniref:DUF4189 domain-containing protein n=1 Tax=Sphingopyxis sp. TaxID=1908224 RepID=UPI002EDA8B23
MVFIGSLASDPVGAKPPPEPPRETPAYEQCPDGTMVPKGQFCPYPPPRVPPPPPVIAQPPLPGEWRSNWGAVAIDTASARLVSVTGFAHMSAAEAAALDDCRAAGGLTCVFGYSYKDMCIAMIEGDRSWFFESAAHVEDAVRTGLERCRSGQAECRVRLSACAPPIFIPY